MNLFASPKHLKHAVTQLLISRTIPVSEKYCTTWDQWIRRFLFLWGWMSGQSQSHVRLRASKPKTWTLSVYSIHDGHIPTLGTYEINRCGTYAGFHWCRCLGPKLWPHQKGRQLPSCRAIFDRLPWVNPWKSHLLLKTGLASDLRIFGTVWTF
jgi:hypothetical protein